MKAIKYNKRKFLMVLLPALVVALALLVSRSSVAQSGDEQWNRTFGGSGWDVGFSVAQTSDGGYIVAGYTRSYDAGADDAWLIKTDSEGNEQWNRVFGGLLLDVGRCVRQTSDGGYIVIGKTWSYGAGCYDVWLIKTDSEGNKQWNRTFGGSEWDVGNCVAQTSDGGYIIAGRTTSYGAGAGDAWLIKTDSEGDEQWNKTFGGLGYYDVSYSVDQTSDGGYIVTGWTRSYGAGRDSVWLIKVGVNPADSTTGDKWYKTFNGFD